MYVAMVTPSSSDLASIFRSQCKYTIRCLLNLDLNSACVKPHELTVVHILLPVQITGTNNCFSVPFLLPAMSGTQHPLLAFLSAGESGCKHLYSLSLCNLCDITKAGPSRKHCYLLVIFTICIVCAYTIYIYGAS